MVEHEIVIVRKRLGPLYDVIDRGAILMTDLALRVRELRDREKTLVRDLKAMRTVASENRVEFVRAEEVLGTWRTSKTCFQQARSRSVKHS